MKARKGFLRRYVLRRDLRRKVLGRAKAFWRKATKNEFRDQRALFSNNPPETIFDVGANIGYVSKHYRKCFPGATVWAFEPTPDTCAVLQDYVKGDSRVRVEQLALSNESGEAEFYVDNQTYGGGANSLLPHSEHFFESAPKADYKAVRVETVRLDDFLARHEIDRVDILKLDVEGAELLVLEGASQALTDSRIGLINAEVRLVADFEGQPLAHDLAAFLAKFGYRTFNLYGFVEDQHRQGLFGNALFIGPELRRRAMRS